MGRQGTFAGRLNARSVISIGLTPRGTALISKLAGLESRRGSGHDGCRLPPSTSPQRHFAWDIVGPCHRMSITASRKENLAAAGRDGTETDATPCYHSDHIADPHWNASGLLLGRRRACIWPNLRLESGFALQSNKVLKQATGSVPPT